LLFAGALQQLDTEQLSAVSAGASSQLDSAVPGLLPASTVGGGGPVASTAQMRALCHSRLFEASLGALADAAHNTVTAQGARDGRGA
jgi:hypothetical protein